MILATGVTSTLVVIVLGIIAVTAGVGFVAGILFERSAAERALQNARKSISRMFSVTNDSLKRAEFACTAIEEMRDINLSPGQRDQLAARRTDLGQSLQRILERARTLPVGLGRRRKAKPQPLNWLMEPADVAVNLPDASTLEANVACLINACQQSGSRGCVGLVSIDRLDRIETRFGESHTSEVRQRVAELIKSELTDSDFQCVADDCSFAVLISENSGTDPTEKADAIRHAIRTHHFRFEGTGSEVLVTASSGFAVCSGTESVAMLLTRCTEAVERSRSHGRNQLAVHDGQRLNEFASPTTSHA